jgi:hypothetical protein
MYISHVHCALRCMCTFVRTSERDGWRRTKSIFSFSLFSSSFFFLALSLSLFSSAGEKEFEILSRLHTHTHIHALLVALLPIYLLSTAHRPMKFQNRRVKRAEKTTATTIGRKKRDGEQREREKKRPIRWTMMMLATERTSNGVRRVELNERMMDRWLDGWLDFPAGSEKQKNAYENEFVVNSVNCTFISFFLCMN